MAAVPVFTRPMYSAMRLGRLPAAVMMRGLGINCIPAILLGGQDQLAGTGIPLRGVGLAAKMVARDPRDVQVPGVVDDLRHDQILGGALAVDVIVFGEHGVFTVWHAVI